MMKNILILLVSFSSLAALRGQYCDEPPKREISAAEMSAGDLILIETRFQSKENNIEYVKYLRTIGAFRDDRNRRIQFFDYLSCAKRKERAAVAFCVKEDLNFEEYEKKTKGVLINREDLKTYLGETYVLLSNSSARVMYRGDLSDADVLVNLKGENEFIVYAQPSLHYSGSGRNAQLSGGDRALGFFVPTNEIIYPCYVPAVPKSYDETGKITAWEFMTKKYPAKLDDEGNPIEWRRRRLYLPKPDGKPIAPVYRRLGFWWLVEEGKILGEDENVILEDTRKFLACKDPLEEEFSSKLFTEGYVEYLVWLDNQTKE